MGPAANKDAVREAGGITALVRVVAAGAAQLQSGQKLSFGLEAPAGALCNLAHESPANSAALVKVRYSTPLRSSGCSLNLYACGHL